MLYLNIFTSVSWAAVKSDSDDSEEETKLTKSKKKSTANSSSMFQASAEKDKDKKTKKKGKFSNNVFLCLRSWSLNNKSIVCFRKGGRKWWFWLRKRRQIKEEKRQREEEKGIIQPTKEQERKQWNIYFHCEWARQQTLMDLIKIYFRQDLHHLTSSLTTWRSLYCSQLRRASPSNAEWHETREEWIRASTLYITFT